MPRILWTAALGLAAATAVAPAAQRSTADTPRSLLTPSLAGRDNFDASVECCLDKNADRNPSSR